MNWIEFLIRSVVAFILGMGIGIERQWLKTRSVLKTNVLVTLGAAMFVMLSVMTPGDASPTRIAAQVVSGIGFLGGGVILREGASVRGINTAATLWCAAAIGSLVGAGFLVQAYFGTLAVVGANLMLRPMVQVFQKKIDRQLDLSHTNNGTIETKSDSNSKQFLETDNERYGFDEKPALMMLQSRHSYRCRFTCHPQDESKVLSKLWEFLLESEAIDLNSIKSHQLQSQPQRVEILVNFQILEIKENFNLIGSLANILQAIVTHDSLDWEFSKEKAEYTSKY
ncbi:MgtC/SapB family protein [Myxosarcina sp. GI1]|uniref:MgtC/SapB family protein n=1 Tax=Myxosarcina sp. GI1 TaxID=1541065 RepID=UPI00068A401A|nr:MgtC/SapB family protein [Myxosarcina sp. GI1]